MRSDMDSPFEIQRLLELLNSNQQESGALLQPAQPLVALNSVETAILDVVGIENRFAAHISQAMSKTKAGPFGAS